MKKFSIYHIVVSLCLLGALVLFSMKSFTNINNHLGWDELNYETLSRKGVAYNAFEKNSLNFIEFYKIGKARADKDTLLNSQLVQQFNYPDENENPFYLRHYHPPLANYYWSLFINKDDIIQNDKNLRYSNICLGFIAILSLFLALFISKKINLTTCFYAIILSSLLVVSTIFNYSFERLNFHTVQFICSLIFLGTLMRWYNLPNKKTAFALGLSVALMFVALETALFVVSGAIIGLIFVRKLKQLLKSLMVVFVAFLIGILALWPGVIKTLAPIKTWIMHFARIFLKGNDEYAGISMGQAWLNLLSDNVFLFSILIVAIVVLFFISRKLLEDKSYKLPYIVAGFYLVTITPFILNKTYVFPVVGLFIFAIIYHISLFKIDLNNSKIKLTSGLLSFMLILIVVLGYLNLDFNSKLSDNKKYREEFNNEVTVLKEKLKDKKNIIAFNGQALRYYLNRPDIVDMRKNTMANPGYYIRKEGLYIDKMEEIKNNKIGAIIFPKENISYYPEERTKILEDYNYLKVDLKYFRIFLSQKNNGY